MTMRTPQKCVAGFLFFTLAVLAVSCSRSTKFSSVLEGGFDPVAIFRQSGYVVQNEGTAEGIRNASSGYGWQSWCGVLTSGQKQADCASVAVVIRNGLNKSLSGGSLDELTGSPQSAGHPLTGMLLYNKDSVHGDMYVWLTPIGTNETVSYTIFLREERLK